MNAIAPSRTAARSRSAALAAAAACLLAASAWAAAPRLEEGTQVEPLPPEELRRLEEQRVLVGQLARRHVGTPLTGRSLDDLRVLQRLVDLKPKRDRRLAGFNEPGFADRAEVYELQSMGVALGDVLASNLGLDWVLVVDDLGRGRALRRKGGRQLYFPVTMISKRYEKGVEIDVRALYDGVARSVAEEVAKTVRRPRRPQGRGVNR